MAARDGRSEISQRDLEEGIDIALGADEEGNGGLEDLGTYGATVLPTGIRGRDVSRSIKRIDDARLVELSGGAVTDRFGNEYSARDFLSTVESFRPDPTDSGRLIPLDDRGGVFLAPDGVVSFSIEDLLDG